MSWLCGSNCGRPATVRPHGPAARTIGWALRPRKELVVPTFMSVPAASADRPGGVTVLGAPCEFGPGEACLGPHAAAAAVRTASAQLLRVRIDNDPDPLRELDVVDGGDVGVSFADRADHVEATTEAVSRILAQGSIPLGLGGDGS